jgi:CHASE2 domain-containing sensor protein
MPSFKNRFELLLNRLRQLLTLGGDLRTWSLSWAAWQSRRFGSRAILAVGVAATVYAGYLWVTHKIAPDAPKPSHDVILKTRWSSPPPSSQIVILDIDERSLAALAAQHGRWPWSRDVLADGLQKVNDLGARAVLFNVMLSDPDKNNADADAAMDVTAQMLPTTAYPLIRLNPKNDSLSQLKVSQLPGAQLKAGADQAGTGQAPTLAAIVPMFAAMQERLGVANQKPDDDGVVRKYPLTWEEATFSLPSLVKRTAELGKMDLAGVPAVMSLNWRNKQGRYTRISFSDLLNSSPDDPKMKVFAQSFVVLGLSAPGLGQTKGTAVTAVEDDNEILATALDDVLHKTYLRILPDWAVLLINLLAIWGLVWMALSATKPAFLNKIFVLAQSGMGGLTLLMASYTNYLIDLSDSMSFGLAVFGAIKMVQSLDDSWSRAKPGMRRVVRDKHSGTLLLLGYRDSQLSAVMAGQLQKALEAIVGMPKVVRVDDLFGGESFIKASCSDYSCLMLLVEPAQWLAVQALLAQPDYANWLRQDQHALEVPWDPNDSHFGQVVSPKLLLNCAAVLEGAQQG